ncbi:hypothetical protein BDF22DRAFT_775638 [Syncephalis plumigaleata]|nr:hypothetical protein BDF22DRAFT_775638 [Syncephalis plumigaleata]
MRFFSTVVTCLLSISAVWSLPVPSEYGSNEVEDLFSDINNIRSQSGAQPLRQIPCLNSVAQDVNQISISLPMLQRHTKLGLQGYNIPYGVCGSEVPQAAHSIGWVAPGNISTLSTYLRNNGLLVNESVLQSQYIGIDKSLPGDGETYWTIILA